ncbi:MAG: hypothetical protein AAGH71_06460 [Planctomycetota bacterium]
MRAVTGFVEYLSAAYSAIGLYGPAHPLVAALIEAVVEATVQLRRDPAIQKYSIDIACGSFLWKGAPVPPKLVSQLASDLHAMNAVVLEVSGALEAPSAHALLSSIYQTRRDGGTIEDVARVAEGIAGRPIRILSLEVDGLSSRSLASAEQDPSRRGLVSDAELAAILREPPEDPTLLADTIVQRVETGNDADAETVRTWLAAESDALRCGGEDEEALRKAWLERCVENLTPEVRATLLRSVPKPDPEWLMSTARLAPVWPVEELIGALENLTGDAMSLRGTGRLLFTQLLGLARRDDQQQRVRSIIETWGANQNDSMLFATDSGAEAGEHFRAQDYADELLEYAERGAGSHAGFPGLEVENPDRIAVRAAEIAFQLAEEEHDPDLAATGVFRSAHSLIRQSRIDLVLRALSQDLEPGGDARSLSRRQRRLIAALRKPDSIRALLQAFETGVEDAGVVRLLDLAREHAASIVLEFASTTDSSDGRSRALAWFRSLPAELRASAIGEHLSVYPQNADMLETVCEGIEAFQIGHCVEHLVSRSQPDHTRAVLRLLGWCTGAWPASVVQHIISTAEDDVVDEAIRSMTSGPAQTRSVTIARVLCSLVTLRKTPVADMEPMIRAVMQDQPVAERALVDLLTVIRSRPSMIARGDAKLVLRALGEFDSVSETTSRVIREWRSPAIQVLGLVGRLGIGKREGRRCA